jgi:signal transduction histidine kinase
LPAEADLVARNGWLIRLRWLAVVCTTLAIGFGELVFPGALAVGPILAVAAAIALYNLQFSLYLRTLRIAPSGTASLRHATAFAYLQIALDLLALALLIHFSGGMENPLTICFVLHVITASVLLQRRVSYLVAGLASALIVVMALLEFGKVVPHYYLPVFGVELYRHVPYLATSIAVVSGTLFLVAYLATSMTERLRERDRELQAAMETSQAKTEELEKVNEQLRRTDAERTRFMVLVTHELRAPVSTIYSCLELALSGVASPEKGREVLKRAENRAMELLSFISDLLSLTRIREQAVPGDTLPLIQVADVLRDVEDLMKVEAERKDIILGVTIAPDLAPVRARADQMKLVWINLVSNAIKYTGPGGIVQISLGQDAEHVIGTVHDTGIGITADDIPKVFDEFYRAGNARLLSPHGTGVGLSIVRRILENLGGRVRAESEPGLGTRFTFTIPRASG